MNVWFLQFISIRNQFDYRVCLREDDMEEWGIMNNISPKLTKSNQDPNKKSPLVEENNIIKDVSYLDV